MKKSIFVQGNPVYVAGDHTACVYNAVLTESLNDAGTLTFTVPPTNPNYDSIAERAKVVLYDETNPYWRGFVISATKNAKNELAVTCVGELAYLNDSIQPQAKYQNKTPRELFTAYVDEHNAQSSEQFAVGFVTVSDPNDNVYRFTNYETTLTALRDDLCASLGGFLRIRYNNGVRTLDLVKIEDYGNSNGQIIEFGENLLDYAEGMSAEEIATQCIPLGVHLEEPVVEGLDAYLDIKSVNAGLDYVQDDDAVAALGEIKRVVHFDNVTDPTTLKDKGIEWLTSAQYAKLTIEVTAVDLSSLGVYVAPVKWRDLAGKKWSDMAGVTWADLKGFDPTKDKFNIGDLVRCFATPYGMDAVYPIQTLVTYLQDPTKNNITLANEKQQTYTQMQATAEAKIKKEASTVLAEAQANASELIKYANEGNVYIKYNEDGKAVELCIMDTDSPDTATKVWRWTLGGFGYSDTGYDGTYTTAITMDGSIVADFITAGVLRLGGVSDDLVLEIYNTAGEKTGTWNATELVLTGTETIYKSSYSAADANKILQYIAGSVQLTADEFIKYDMNLDGNIGPGDSTIVQKFVNGDYGNYITKTTTLKLKANTRLLETSVTSVAANNSASWTNGNGIKLLGSGLVAGGNGRTRIGDSVETQSVFVFDSVSAASYITRSFEEIKEHIKPVKSMLDKVKLADICTYDLKAEKNGNKHIGMVLGDSYNVPEEIIGYDKNGEPEGIDLYSMCSMLWKAVQELSAEVEELRGGKDAAHK